jgi:transposase
MPLQQTDESPIAAEIKEHIRSLELKIETYDANIARVLEKPELAMPARHLKSAPGIGPITAATLLALLPELGRRSAKTIAALALLHSPASLAASAANVAHMGDARPCEGFSSWLQDTPPNIAPFRPSPRGSKQREKPES